MSTDHTVEVDGARVHYVDDGAGPTLLLLHGNPTSSFLYRHVIAGLRDRFRCVALDYPGFGRSVAPPGYGFTPREHSRVVERAVDLLGLRDLTLFVQDWGGPIGLGFAGRRPELVRRIVAANTWAWPVNGDLHFEYFSRLMGGSVGRFFILRYNAFVNLLIPAGVKRKKLSPGDLPAGDPRVARLSRGGGSRVGGAPRSAGARALGDEGHRLPRQGAGTARAVLSEAPLGDPGVRRALRAGGRAGGDHRRGDGMGGGDWRLLGCRVLEEERRRGQPPGEEICDKGVTSRVHA
jgi:pimeloyl-ACP methyl ester carboxylesterase